MALTSPGGWAILPALMRRLLTVALAVTALAGLQGCQNSCQDLGDRICSCSGGGTSSDTCKQQIKNLLDSVGAKSDDKHFCSARLNQCGVPARLQHPGQPDDVPFCDWLASEAGKVCCGLAEATTSTEFPDTNAVCQELKDPTSTP